MQDKNKGDEDATKKFAEISNGAFSRRNTLSCEVCTS